jgi:translation initiation factor 1A
MPKNTKGGKGAKKGKNYAKSDTKLILKDNDTEEYGIVKSKLGNGRFTISCNDNIERIGIIRGKDRKRKWVNLNNIVLVQKWDFTTSENKCTIINIYDNSQINKLIKTNQITKSLITVSDNNFDNSNDIDDVFDYSVHESDDEESDDEESDAEESDDEESDAEESKIINIDDI